MKVKEYKVILSATILIAFLSVSAFGQSGTTILGHVTDRWGAVIFGATVTLIGSLGEVGKTQTIGDGEFRFVGVQQGKYQLAVKWSGVNRAVTKSVRVVGSRSKLVNVAVDFSPCAGIESSKARALTETDRAEIVRQLLDLSMENDSLTAHSGSNVAEFIMAPNNIRFEWLTDEQRRRIKIMKRDEMQRVTEKFGEINYLRIMPLKQHGACVEATVTMNVTVKGQMEDANMAGGGATYEFFRTAGHWVGKWFSAWVV